MIAKLRIVEEEADESIYWVELLVDSKLVSSAHAERLLQETDEIIAMTVASIRTLQKRNSSPFINRKSKIENHSGEAMAQKTILIVDDTDWNRDLLVQLLQEEYKVLEAADGAEGVRRTEESRPDLILMDLGMPVMDGWEATRRIKANDALRHIPVIAVTSHAMVGDEIEARNAGCDDYLPKPIDEDLLLQKIKAFLG